MAKTYELRFDPKSGKYLTVDVTATLKHRENGVYVEADSAETRFIAKKENLLAVETRTVGRAVVGKVGVLDSALERADFDEIIREPIDLQVIAKPAAPAGGTPPADVSQTCQVRIEPMPASITVVRPTPDELPWPARADRPLELALQLRKGGTQKPLANTLVTLERRSASKPAQGTFEPPGPPPQSTDKEGKVVFAYTPPDLWYRPGGVYVEEFAVVTGPDRREIGTVKLPLAPRLKATLQPEKQVKVGEIDVGIGFEPRLIELDLGPGLQPHEIVIKPRVEDEVKGEQIKLPVAFAKVRIEVADGKETIAVFAEGSEPRTDDKGEYVWTLPELARAFPQPTRLDLETNDQNPVGALNAATAKIMTFCEQKIEENFPNTLVEGPLATSIEEYRRDFVGHLAAKDPSLFGRAWAAAELLTAGATHTKLFNNLYNQQWSAMGDVLGNVLGDLLALGVNLVGVGDKCIKEWGPAAPAYFRSWVEYLADMPGIRTVLGFVQGTLNSGLRRCQSALHALNEFLTAHLPGTWSSISGRFSAMLAQLGNDIEELVRLKFSETVDTVGEVASTVAEWLYKALKLIFGAVGRVLVLLADCLHGLLSFAITKLGEAFSALYVALDPVIEAYITPAMQRVAGYIRTNVTHGLTDEEHGYIGLSLAKLIEALIGWFNQEHLKGTERMGNKAGATIVANLVLMDMLADPVLNGILQDARNLKVPADHAPPLKTFRDYCLSCRDVVAKNEKDLASIDEWMSHIDNFILCCECIVMLVMTLFSLGGAVMIGEFFTKLEIVIGAFKLALVRLPQGIAVLVAAFAVAVEYALGTTALTANA